MNAPKIKTESKWVSRIKSLSPVAIILCAIFLGIEANWHDKPEFYLLFTLSDIIFLVYFIIEIFVRLRYPEFAFSQFLSALKNNLPKVSPLGKGNGKDIQVVKFSVSHEPIEEWGWLIFDFLIVFFGVLSFFSHFVEHPEAIAILRLFRIFRVLRIFEISPTLKSIEKKIISVIPTVFVFALLLFMIIFVYAVIGMYIYGFKTYATIDFSSLYSAMIGLFILSTNGWAGALHDLETNGGWVSPLFTDFYIISFIVFSVMVTLNVFIAVMTGHIQDKLQPDMKKIDGKEDLLLRKVDQNLGTMTSEFNQMKNEFEQLKKEIKSGRGES